MVNRIPDDGHDYADLYDHTWEAVVKSLTRWPVYLKVTGLISGERGDCFLGVKKPSL